MADEKTDAFHQAMDRSHVRALWEADAHGKRRNAIEPAWLWRWAELEPLVDQAVAAVGMGDAERRVLSFVNPHYGRENSCGTRNLAAALQILLPGERARPHRHSMNALRFVLEGSGVTTIVDGKRCPMEDRDLILTPGWTWHEHVHEGDKRMVWFDSLDSPLHRYFGTAEFEPGPIHDIPATQADAAFSAPGMVPAGSIAPEASTYSPLFRYPWREARAALDRMPADAEGTRLLHYVNPQTGRSVMGLMDCYLLALSKGLDAKPKRAESNIVCVVAEGEGRSEIGETTIDWSRNDIFTIPRGNLFHHRAASKDAVLFLSTDREMLRRLGLLSTRPTETRAP